MSLVVSEDGKLVMLFSLSLGFVYIPEKFLGSCFLSLPSSFFFLFLYFSSVIVQGKSCYIAQISFIRLMPLLPG